MSAPKNPIIRAVTAVATMGASELVGAGVSVGKALVKGENVGDAFTRDRLRVGRADRITGGDILSLSPMNAGTALGNELQKAGTGELLQGVGSTFAPQKGDVNDLDMNPSVSPTMSPTLSPAASLRKRRNFSTILTSPLGVREDANVARSTLLGGVQQPIGR